MDAAPEKPSQKPPQSASEITGYSIISPQVPSSVIERVGFSYKPPEDPLEAAHNREMARSKERFRQTLVLIVLSVTVVVALLVTGACGYIALFDTEADLRKNALTALSGIVGTLFGAVLGLNGAKLLGAEDKNDKE